MYMNTKIKVLILFLCLIAPVSYVVPKTVVHPWKNKKVAFFGDSITDPNIKTKGTDSKGRTNMHYWDYLHEWLGITPYVYAITKHIDKKTFKITYEDDTTQYYPVKFFVHGTQYKVLGFID